MNINDDVFGHILVNNCAAARVNTLKWHFKDFIWECRKFLGQKLLEGIGYDRF